jgi:hypothetical protein
MSPAEQELELMQSSMHHKSGRATLKYNCGSLERSQCLVAFSEIILNAFFFFLAVLLGMNKLHEHKKFPSQLTLTAELVNLDV